MSLGLPIRLRLTLAFALSTALLLAAAGTFLYLRLQEQLGSATDASLRAQADVLVSGIGQQGTSFGDTTGPAAQEGQPFAQILTSAGQIQESSEPVSHAPLLSPAQIRSLAGPTLFDRPVPGIEGVSRLYALPVTEGSARLAVVVGTSLNASGEILSRFLLLLLIGGPMALAIASLAGWLIAGSALRPVERMRREAQAISLSDRSHRLPVPRSGDEIARLGVTLNSMLDDLQQSFDRERRFVDDASHELRTPLAILKTELDIALSRARTPQELESALRSASQEADRLTALAGDLLVYSTMEQDRVAVHRQRVHIDHLIGEARDSFSRQAADAEVSINVDVPPITVEVDPTRVRQALDNMIANALRHTPAGGSVSVSAAVEGSSVRILVEDTGAGFEPAMIPVVFEPFTRGSPDRAASAPGAGLGLAIVQAVAQAHGGEAAVMNRPEGGAIVSLMLPRTEGYVPDPPIARLPPQ